MNDKKELRKLMFMYSDLELKALKPQNVNDTDMLMEMK